MYLKTIFQSLLDDLKEGKITLRQAAEELHEANYIPYIDEEETLRRLKQYEKFCNSAL